MSGTFDNFQSHKLLFSEGKLFKSVKVIMKLSRTQDPSTARQWRNGPIPASGERDSDRGTCLQSGLGGSLLVISIYGENMPLTSYPVFCYER